MSTRSTLNVSNNKAAPLAISPKSQQLYVRDRIQGWVNNLEDNHRLEAGLEPGRPTPIPKLDEILDQKQRQDAVHQLWFQSARDKILEIGRLQTENKSLKDEIANNSVEHQEVTPIIEELKAEVESLKAQNNELTEITIAKDQTIDTLSQDNEFLRNEVHQSHRTTSIQSDGSEAEIREQREAIASGPADARRLEGALNCIRLFSEAQDKQAVELQHTKQLLKDAHSELEIANHHLRLRKESIATLEAIQRKSSITNVGLFEAETYIRNDLETQCNDFKSQLEDMRVENEDLKDRMDWLHLYGGIWQEEIHELKWAANVANQQRDSLAEELRCLDDTRKQEAVEKDAKIMELLEELNREREKNKVTNRKLEKEYKNLENAGLHWRAERKANLARDEILETALNRADEMISNLRREFDLDEK